MADISSGDVQRIVNDAANQLRGTLNDMRSQINENARGADDIARTRQQVDDMSRRIINIEQLLQQVIQQTQLTQQSVAGNARSDQYTAIMAQQLNELRVRFVAVEKFAAQMSDYVQKVRARDAEDQGYKHVSG